MKSLLQTPEWVSLKVGQGWKSHDVEGIFVLEKPLPFGRSFLYAPEVTWSDLTSHPEAEPKDLSRMGVAASAADSSLAAQNDIHNFLQKLQKNIKKNGTIFFRLEFIDENSSEIVKKLRENKFIKAFEELQPEWRQIIDISKSEEEILAQMKPKGRYNIKIAQKHGLEKSKIKDQRSKIDIFYQLYQETARYQKLSIRNKQYFIDMVEALEPKDEIAIIIAEYQGQPLAALLVTFYDKVASYLYGGTSRENKQVMAPYLAHWAAIQEAKRRGCIKYDMLAVSPDVIASDSEAIFRSPRPGGVRDDKHKYDNLTRFKEQFGGKKVNITGSYDLVYKPGWYRLFKFVEQYRRK